MAVLMALTVGLVTAWSASVALVLLVYRRELTILWREPVFRVPILIVESDDWGAGPLTQANALRQIADVLQRHRDVTGRSPVMTLALILAVPDGPAIRAHGCYRAVELDDPRFTSVLDALQEGKARGLFSLQLHGLEHYWPPALMASGDPAVQQWLQGKVPAATEQLPSHLQSRWVDARGLPSESLSCEDIEEAVATEVQIFERVVGESPRVVVPPTFVWTRAVEAAWEAAGLRCIVTPGWRYPCRDAQGRPGGDEGPIANGDRVGGLTYLVRTDYFEPSRGRDAEHALTVFEKVVAQGRPCLLENHRDNFIGGTAACQESLRQLDALVSEGLARFPRTRFLSTQELCEIARDANPEWVHLRLRDRLPFVWERLRHSGRLWRLLKLAGLAGLGRWVIQLIRPSTPFVT